MNDKYLSPFLDNRNRLFENEIGFVIYDGFPVSEGHCLIIPKRVYSDYFDSTEQELKGLNELVFRTKEYLDKKAFVKLAFTFIILDSGLNKCVI